MSCSRGRFCLALRQLGIQAGSEAGGFSALGWVKVWASGGRYFVGKVGIGIVCWVWVWGWVGWVIEEGVGECYGEDYNKSGQSTHDKGDFVAAEPQKSFSFI